jgi:hypothetical protein
MKSQNPTPIQAPDEERHLMPIEELGGAEPEDQRMHVPLRLQSILACGARGVS